MSARRSWTAQKQNTPAPRPMRIDAAGVTKPAAGVIATRPATAPAAAPSTVGVPVCSQLTVIQVSAAMAAAMLVTTKAEAARPLAPRALTGIEAEPAEPEQAGAEDGHRQVVRLDRRLDQPGAAAEDQRGDQGRDAAREMDDGAAGEVERAEVEQPAIGRPDPVGERGVDEGRPGER